MPRRTLCLPPLRLPHRWIEQLACLRTRHLLPHTDEEEGFLRPSDEKLPGHALALSMGKVRAPGAVCLRIEGLVCCLWAAQPEEAGHALAGALLGGQGALLVITVGVTWPQLLPHAAPHCHRRCGKWCGSTRT